MVRHYSLTGLPNSQNNKTKKNSTKKPKIKWVPGTKSLVEVGGKAPEVVSIIEIMYNSGLESIFLIPVLNSPPLVAWGYILAKNAKKYNNELL